MSVIQNQQKILHALHVLGCVTKEHKVGISDQIYIEPADKVWTSVSRWYHSQSRTANFEAIEKIFKDALEHCDQLLRHREFLLKHKNPSDLQIMENSQLITQYQTEIKNAIKGTNNLTITYQKDATAVARIYTITKFVYNALERVNTRYVSLELFSPTKDKEEETSEDDDSDRSM